jgi:phage terminase large subunit
MNAIATSEIEFPEKLQFLFEEGWRFKVAHGGRGGAKSWGFARALILMASQKKLRILCVRELQSSIQESVHKLLGDQIVSMGLAGQFVVEKARIYNPLTGSEFFFEGIRHNSQKVKSYEGIDIAWVEEAALITKESWEVLEPTIRKPNSEIWVSFNPDLETDFISQMFIESPPDDAIVQEISWRDNPWFPVVLQASMERLRAKDFDSYLHVWEGEYKLLLEGAIYAEELRAAYAERRVRYVPYDSSIPVDTYWDLGRSDATCIWFIQRVGMEVRVLDYYGNRLKLLDHYLQVVQSRGYTYRTHYLPHDAKAKLLSMKRSIEHQARAKLKSVQIVPRVGLIDGINATRTLFGQCFFDRKKCKEGLKALKAYRWGVDSSKSHLKNIPVHDWASDPADAFRMAGVAFKGPKVDFQSEVIDRLKNAAPPPPPPSVSIGEATGWMN